LPSFAYAGEHRSACDWIDPRAASSYASGAVVAATDWAGSNCEKLL